MEKRKYKAEEKNAIQELENRFKNVTMSPGLTVEEEVLFYRFLRARDFNVDKAEKMLRKHIEWRKVHQVDKILEVFKPKEAFVKYVQPSFVGFDKDGDLIRYLKAGKINTTALMKCFKMNDFMKHWIWFAEVNKFLVVEQSRKIDKPVALVGIMDLDGLEFANATSKTSIDMFLRFIQLVQDNYPEGLKSVYVINAPAFYVISFTIFKAIMTNITLRKIHFFGYSGWKEKLQEVVDADVLPVFLGGKRTEPDGDPYCRSFITIPEKISERYYLTEEERYFKDPTEVQTLIIRPSEKEDVFIQIKEVGSSIHWKFTVRSKTIGFGLFFQDSQKVREEIIPIYEYDTPDGTEEGSYKCFSEGKYVIIFDNSCSMFTTKEVQYVISVEKPGLT